MKKLIQKPFLIFFGLVPVALVFAFIFKNDFIEGSYFGGVVSFGYKIIFVISAVFFCLIGVNYWSLNLLNKQPKKLLNIIHIVLQLIAFSLLIYYAFSFDYSLNYEQQESLNFKFFIGILVFISSVFVHLINFFWSLLSKENQSIE